MDTAPHNTPCRVFIHPAVKSDRIFEVRRLARDEGCIFVTTKRKVAPVTPGNGPWNGGSAA